MVTRLWLHANKLCNWGVATWQQLYYMDEIPQGQRVPSEAAHSMCKILMKQKSVDAAACNGLPPLVYWLACLPGGMEVPGSIPGLGPSM